MTVAESNRRRAGTRRGGSKSLSEVNPELSREIMIADPESVSAGSHWKFPWRCAEGHVWMSRPNNRKSGTGCPQCVKGVRASEVSPGLREDWSPVNDRSFDSVSRQSAFRAAWKCRSGHEWDSTVYDRVRGRGCPKCALVRSVSSPEREVASLLDSWGVGYVSSDRSVLAGREVDIYVPSAGVAIEFNGLYWHGDRFKSRSYHRDKSDLARAAGVQLIHVWEDDWLERRGVVESMISRKLGVSTEDRVNARSLTKVILTTREARKFLDSHHLQGFSNGSEYYGLSEGGEVRAVLVMKRRGGGEWELVRFATNAIVRGGHSRLFKWFTEDHPEVERVVTFADQGVSDGGLYETCGFSRDRVLPPDYTYVVGRRRVHKFNYRLKRFRDDPLLEYREGMSERELADINNIPRIWDAGKIRYVWTRT